MAIGASIGGIEHSYLRVLRMMQKMMTNQDVSDEKINEFNRSINQGGILGIWFKKNLANFVVLIYASAIFQLRIWLRNSFILIKLDSVT